MGHFDPHGCKRCFAPEKPSRNKIVTLLTWFYPWGFICDNICNIPTYWWPTKPRISKVTTSKVGTWRFCVMQQMYFTSVTWRYDSSGFICVNICNISTYWWPPEPGILRSLPQKWVINPSLGVGSFWTPEHPYIWSIEVKERIRWVSFFLRITLYGST